jgi:hypothetical protein
MTGVKPSLQKRQDLAFLAKGASQYGHNKRGFLQVLQNLASLSKGSSQYGHIKAAILTGGKSSKRPS